MEYIFPNLFSCLYLFLFSLLKQTTITNMRAVFKFFFFFKIIHEGFEEKAENTPSDPCRIRFLCLISTMKLISAGSGKPCWMACMAASTYRDLIIFVYYWRMMMQKVESQPDRHSHTVALCLCDSLFF